MAIMKNEDYMYMYSQISNDKIPLHIREKIEKGMDLTDTEEKEMLNIIENDISLKKIIH